MDLYPAVFWVAALLGLVVTLRLIGLGIRKLWDVTRPSPPGPDEVLPE